MVILRFELILVLVTYLFHVDPKSMIYPCVVLYNICEPRSVMISQKLRPVSVNSDTFIVHLNMNTEG